MIAWAFFKNGERRARIWLTIILGALVLGIGLILLGIYQISSQQKDLIGYAETSRQRWEALRKLNPHLVVPEVVESDSVKVIVPPDAPPAPTPTPTPSPSPTPTLTPAATPKVVRAQSSRTPRRHSKPKPTPTPWFHFFKQTR